MRRNNHTRGKRVGVKGPPVTTVPSSPPSSANQFDFLIRCKWNQPRANAGWHRGGRASLLELVAIPLGPFTGVKAKRHDHAAPMEKAVRPDRQAGRHWGVCTCNLENVLLQIKTIQQRGHQMGVCVCFFFFKWRSTPLHRDSNFSLPMLDWFWCGKRVLQSFAGSLHINPIYPYHKLFCVCVLGTAQH